ncbi:MAG: cobalt transporter CbiM [Candidatus Hydrogenedentes bacterium]|nr:cobalt transporter CbiM [Candidatus Hydrogenedentota bacterium]
MHLSEGIVTSPLILGGGVVLACAGVAMGLRKMDESHALRTAVLGSGFFVASLIHIPLFGVSVHLTLAGLLGIVLGWAAFPAILVGLVLQAVLFGFGGISTLGLNTCIMALPAVAAYYASRTLLRHPDSPHAVWVCGVLGAGSVAFSAVLLAAILRTAGEAFALVAWSVLIANLPVMVIEAGVTATAVGFLAKVSPELLAGTSHWADGETKEELSSCD